MGKKITTSFVFGGISMRKAFSSFETYIIDFSTNNIYNLEEFNNLKNLSTTELIKDEEE